jgi:hypothetical protein
MNKEHSMDHVDTERLILTRALDAMRKETGLTATLLQWEPQLDVLNRRPDALVEIAGPQVTQQFAVEVKNKVDRFEIFNQLRAFWPRHAVQPLLVAAPYVTPQAAERCRELDLCFVDTAGNAYLQAPGLHIYVTGKRKPTDLIAAEGRAVTPAGLRIVFGLLCQPQLLNATQRDIAATARVALGTVGPVMKDLENRKHITPALEHGPTPRRRFLNPQRLFEEWVGAYPTALRPKLNARRFRGLQPNWTEGVDLAPYGAFWGGEVAANKLLHYLQPQTATIYVAGPPNKLIVDHRLKADINGDIEILDVFWHPERLPAIRDIVPPVLAYADLFTTTEGRDLEAAKMVYDKYIGPALRNQA